MTKLGVGLYGMNAHQIHGLLVEHPRARCVATAAIDPALLPEPLRTAPDVRHYESLEEMLQDPRVALVSLCSPRRRDQAQQAILCMEAGRHVYAEKPCAMTEEALDDIMEATRRTGQTFHEMAGTAFEQPYLTMREIVQAGTLGTVVQVLAQKSYPYHDRRPQDEDVDGGLLLQVGVHALRFIEHVAGVQVREIFAVQTRLGNPKAGGLHMATSMMMTLANGGVASVLCNYLNPPGFGQWGNETLRIFGTNGFVEAVDGGTRTRLVLQDEDRGPLEIHEPSRSYFDMMVAEILDGTPMPLSLEEELHPTRMVIRAREDAVAREEAR